MSKDKKVFAALLTVFLVAYFLPVTDPRIQTALLEAFKMLQWYAQKHTLGCVVPAMFIAGAIATFLSKEAVLRHLGPRANKVEAYGVASVAGTVLAVCSCSVLPMFAGIYRAGAGLGPAAAFLYSGPAINVMAIFLTASVLGVQLGVARTIGAVVFSVVIGVLMALLFRKDESARTAAAMQMPEPPASKHAGWQIALFFFTMIGFLVFSDWANPSSTILQVSGRPTVALARGGTAQLPENVELNVDVMEETSGDMTLQLREPVGELNKGTQFTVLRSAIAPGSVRQVVPEGYQWTMDIYQVRWLIAAAFAAVLIGMVWMWFDREEISEWMDNTWFFAKQIIPLLFGGVFITGFVATLLPPEYVGRWVGGNGLLANFIASLTGALWYFATLTEIPILQALQSLGMGDGPALTLLLAGPALSLPSIAVIYSVLGLKKTTAFVVLIVVMSTLVGMTYGTLFV
jgi:uncharacterized membrane protein YraQ (UPF0718 family)